MRAYGPSMDMDATIVVLAAGAVATLAALWGSRRKRAFGTVSLVPWTAIMFVGVTALVIGAAHLATLFGGGTR